MRINVSRPVPHLAARHVTFPSPPAAALQPRPRGFSTTLRDPKKTDLPPRPKLPVEETTKAYLKGSGPGGQKINKTSSAVQLTHIPTGIVVKCQATRSRTQNESVARRLLAEKVEVLEKGSESRVEKKRERESKRTRSGEKKRRRKYRALQEAVSRGVEGEGEEAEAGRAEKSS